MTTYIAMLRGINVGGKNKIPMAELKARLEDLGFKGVTTYIQSGNVILRSDLDAKTLRAKIEDMLASSNGASNSSSTQNGLGLTW